MCSVQVQCFSDILYPLLAEFTDMELTDTGLVRATTATDHRIHILLMLSTQRISGETSVTRGFMEQQRQRHH